MLTRKSTIIYLALGLLLSGGPYLAHSQSIRINEAAPTNMSLLDEDGDSPDWFEFYNYGTDIIQLNGWSISDNKADTLKWLLPEISLAPDQYMLLWASGKDRKTIGFPRTLVAPGGTVKYLLPTAAPAANWTQVGYDDQNWSTGNTGIGYGDNDDATVVPGGTIAVFLRKEFTVTNKEDLLELILDIDYDDAFVAYLNGVEVARAGINNNPPAFNQTASLGHEANLHRGLPLDRFSIANAQAILNNGSNILSIQAHNISSNSSDMTILPALSALYSSPQADGITPPEILNLGDQYLHTNFQLSSAGETIYLFNNQQTLVDSLRLPPMTGEISLGKQDNSGQVLFYDTPTPGLPNSANAYLGLVTSVLQFSNDGGMSTPLSLTISGQGQDEEIRYTTDGTIPNQNSALYDGPLAINQTTIVKARIFKPDYLPGTVATRSYIMGNSHQLPVVSLTFDHDDFFDPVNGMYVLGEGYSGDVPYFGSNIWEEWERPVNFEFYETDGSLGISIPMGAKIFGGWSRANAQRSLSLFARGSYGRSSLDYPLFKRLNYASFQALILRNSGNDWRNTQIRDATITSLMEGSGLEYQAFRPVVTYFNGEYWGFYNIREKVNEHFLASKFGVDPDDIDLLEFNGDVVEGSNTEYFNLLDFIQANSLTNQANYEYVKSKIDIDNYLSYLVVQIYADNTDWPGNNIKFWNHPGGKWRWILYDTDFGFGPWDNNAFYHNTLEFALEANGPGWPNPPWSTFLFRRLVQSEEFRHDLINRFADFLNSRFREDNVVAHIDSIAAIVAPEMAQHMARWNGNYNGWSSNISRMKNFGRNRPGVLRTHIKERFTLASTYNVQIENLHPAHGIVQLNSLIIDESLWSGLYFSNVPVSIEAMAREGYRFTHWSGSVDSQDPQLTLTLVDNIILKANFEPIPGEQQPVVINEINYNSDSERPAGDWVELYNPNPDPVNVSNWIFKDDNDLHIFRLPDFQTIAARGYLVLCRDQTAFSTVYPEVEPVRGNFNFGLGSTSDQARVFNAEGELQDAVSYSSLPPWPASANGTGATLELLSPELDNSLPENWGKINAFGSPGRANNLPTGVTEAAPPLDIQVYPNPVNDLLTISYNDGASGPLFLQIVDLRGVVRLEKTFLNTPQEISLAQLNRGTYLLRFIRSNGAHQSIRVVRQ